MPRRTRTQRKQSRKRTGGGGRLEATRERHMLDPVLIARADNVPLQVKRNNRFTFSQTISLGTVTSSGTAGAEVDGAFYFYLGQCDGVSALTGVFDQYRFLQVSVTFEPIFNVWASTTSGSVGSLVTALDYDDATSTSASGLRQKETCVYCTGNTGITRTLTPHAAMALYSGSFASYGNVTTPWIDSASVNVQHYAVKWAFSGCTLTSTAIYNVFARFVLQFRQIQ